MKDHDLEQIILEAESLIGRLKALKVRHEAPTVRGIPFDHDDIIGLTNFEQSTGYTAVDMTTAAAEGFRDGRDSVVVDLPESRLEGNLISNYSPEKMARNRAIEECRTAIIAAGGKVKE